MNPAVSPAGFFVFGIETPTPELPAPIDEALQAVSHRIIITRMMTLLTHRGVLVEEEVFVTAGAAQVALVLPRLARPTLGWRLRIQPKVAEDLLNHRPLQDRRDDLELAAAAVRAVLHVDVKDALEQPRPTDAVRTSLDSLDFALGGGCSSQ